MRRPLETIYALALTSMENKQLSARCQYREAGLLQSPSTKSVGNPQWVIHRILAIQLQQCVAHCRDTYAQPSASSQINFTNKSVNRTTEYWVNFTQSKFYPSCCSRRLLAAADSATVAHRSLSGEVSLIAIQRLWTVHQMVLDEDLNLSVHTRLVRVNTNIFLQQLITAIKNFNSSVSMPYLGVL